MRNTLPLTLVDQAILSAFALGANLLLISMVEPAAFGQFAYTLAAILIFTSLQNALVCMPIAVYVPAQNAGQQDSLLGVLWRVDVLYRIAACVIAALVLGSLDAEPAYLGAAVALLAASLWRETARSTLFATQRFGRCLLLDGVAVLASIVSAYALWSVVEPVVAVLGAMAIGNAIAVCVLAIRPRAGATETIAAIRTYRAYWSEVKWSAVGVAATEAQYRSYVFAVEWLRGLDTLGHIQAGRVVMGPLTLCVTAWGRVARSSIARLIASEQRAEAVSVLCTGLVLLAGLVCAYALALYLAWPLFDDLVFRGRYSDIAVLTACWFAYTVINAFTSAIGVFVQAAREFRGLAFSSIATSGTSLILLCGLAFDVQPAYAIGAITVGELVALCWTGRLAFLVATSSAGSSLREQAEAA